MDQEVAKAQPVQRIMKVRRDYNRWVSDETLEDYALRFTPRSFRKWSEFRVANTAFGAVSFLALEAIGAAITLSYGFTNAMWAIAVVSLVIFLTGLPIAYRAARHGLDMDLLARGAGFGYLGSTITSLIYASFTFIFFAIEAAIMAQAFELWFGLPRGVGYLLSALIVVPLVTHGVTLISRLQIWTQPVWLLLLVLPFIAVAIKNPDAFVAFSSLNGSSAGSDEFSWAAFGAAATVAASLIAQIGEQVDFLRFMPEPTPGRKLRWWLAVIVAGPGWILMGAAKMVGGAFLAFLVLQHEMPLLRALEPMQMYLIGFREVVGDHGGAIFLAGVFVIVSQLKINITNAYAGSLAWSNFFARLTHSHPGRVVWLAFNVLIAVLLMVMGVFEAIEQVLGLYAHLAVAWVGAVVADLVISKPLGLSPRTIEFRRAYLYDINPSGFGAMLIASVLSVAVYVGLFGEGLRPASTGIALLVSLLAAPLISLLTRQRYTIARTPVDFGPRHRVMRCAICRNKFESDDMAHCPAYGGSICSLCCTLDARCGDRCKTGARVHEQLADLLAGWLPHRVSLPMARRVGQFALVLGGMVCVFGAMLWLLYAQELLHPGGPVSADLAPLFWKVFAGIFLLTAVAAWWLVLANESRVVAQEESDRQNQLLQREIDAHRQTDAALQKAKEVAESGNLAKSRFVTGMSHEMRAPLNSILGYSQVLLRQQALAGGLRDAVSTIHRSGEHLASLVDGLLDLSRIEAGKLRLEQEGLHLEEFFTEIVKMFRPLAESSGLSFHYEARGHLPQRVHADPKRLRQILINLLGNAVKFTEHGQVCLRVRYRREIAHIEVIDTGVGIDAAEHERIFQPFERGAGRVGAEGTGLGLTITRLLVELMGGDIQLYSKRGEGSRFVVRLYLPTLPTLPSVEVSALAAPVCGYLGRRQHVLIVDDEAAHRGVLRAMLQPLGFLIEEVDSGAACLAVLAERTPDLLLLDISLRDTTGWVICRQLREAGHSTLAIVMVSANAHDNTEQARAQSGCNGFVTKPVTEADLLEQVRSALGIEWLHAAPAAAPRLVPPGPDVLRELLALAAGGYPRALRARLEELGDDSPDLAPWAARSLALIGTDDAALTATLSQTLQDHAFS
ncbi:ATP-binding protein [Niveibacterium sp. COAC-50]|uniref:hybrid sensor histidine kinase/response regulator n=1 Tax=Niveibacterium sp. COAC-50 TaxID=2729384 RepID=UPI001C130A51